MTAHRLPIHLLPILAILFCGTLWSASGEVSRKKPEQPSASQALGQKVKVQIKILLNDLAGKDEKERMQAERALANFGPAVRGKIQALKGSKASHVSEAAKRLLALPALSNPLPRVKIILSRGSIELVLFPQDAPNTTANFLKLAGNHFYDGLRFHRVIERFLVQGGDPTNTGRGGPGYHIKDEISAEPLGLDTLSVRALTKLMKMRRPRNLKAVGDMTLKELYEKQGSTFVKGLHSHPVIRGTLAMANMGPNTNGSQFFIAQIDCPWLNGKNTAFGQVVKGLDLVDSIQINERMVRVEVLDRAGASTVVKKNQGN